nr:AsmA family protein [Methylibium sp.]
WLAWPFLRGPLERGLERGLSREVSIGQDFGVRLFGSIRARSDSLVIGPPPGGPHLENAAGQPRDFLSASNFALTVPYSTVLALWRPQPDSVLRVRSLEVDELDMTLVRDAEGRANWQFGTEPKEPEKEQAELPRFDRLVVQRAQIAVEDAVTQVVVQAQLRTHEGSAGAASPAASASPGASPPQPAGSDPRNADTTSAPARGLEATAVGSYRKSKLEARLQTSGLLPLAASGADAEPVPVVLDLQVGETEFHLDGTARDVLALTALDAQFRLAGPSLSAVGDSLGMTLPTTAAFETNGRVRKELEVWRIGVSRLAVGSSRLQADLVFDRSAPVPSLSGTLGGARLALPDLAPAFGAQPDEDEQAAKSQAKAKAKAKADLAKRGRVLPEREFDVPSLAQMQADLKLEFKQVDLGTPQLEPFAPLNGRLRLKDSRLAIDNLLARNSGGELRGALSLDAKSQKAPIWNADLRWSGIRLERFVKAGQGRDTKADQPARVGYVGGALSGQAKLQGRGRSTAQMLGSLDGSTQWWVREGSMSHLLLEVTGIDIAEGLGLVISGDELLPVQCAVARTVVKDGLMSIEVGVIDTPDTTVLVGGTVALGKEQLDLRLTANPKDFSPLALRAPVRVEGSFADPKVGLETKALGLRALAGVALATVVTPLAGLLALVDLGEEEKAVCQKAVERLRSAAPPAKPPPRKR